MSLGYVLGRILGTIPLLVGISLILFTIIHFAPGGPLDVYMDNPSVSKEALEQIAKAYGLDQPVPVQYLLWLKSMLLGDWGYSIRTGSPSWARFCSGSADVRTRRSRAPDLALLRYSARHRERGAAQQQA